LTLMGRAVSLKVIFRERLSYAVIPWENNG